MNGDDYPLNTVCEIIIMIQMFLHEKGLFWKLLDHPEFAKLCNVVDNTMKERHSMGLGVHKSAEVISMEMRLSSLRVGFLGEDSPEKLLKAVVYILGMHCALRGGAEHNNTRRPGFNSQFTITSDNHSKECLVYCEDPLQKTNQDRLVCKGSAKRVYVYGAEDKRYCPIRLFKKYTELLLKGGKCKKFYLYVRKNLTPSLWNCDQPLGKNKIKCTVKVVCKAIGLDRKFTNHSLRATCTSHVFKNDVLEQIIKEVTGHKSDCVHIYKCTFDKLREETSHTVSKFDSQSKKIKVEDVKNVKTEPQVQEKEVGALSMEQMIENVNKTKVELHHKKFQLARSHLSLKSLRQKNSVTIDVNVNVSK